MNKIHLCVLPLALLLAAYSGESVAGEPKRTADPEKMPDCTGDPNAPMVNFNINSMLANPPCVKARLGSIIVFKLRPKNDLENVIVEIEPKDSFDEWLQGKNDRFNDVIVIRVPGTYEPASEHSKSNHDYIIVVDDQKVDPRVEIEH